MHRLQKGFFITIEGIDFSGKSLQVQKLIDQLERLDFSVQWFREPGGTPLSEKIREILLDHSYGEMQSVTELLLYSAARAQLVHEKILPLLREGNIVICDRFADSSTAYQGYGRNIPLDLVFKAHAIAVGNLKPALTFLLDIDPAEAFKRKAKGRRLDRLESEKLEFYRRVREGYLKIAAQEQDRVVVIDAMRAPDEIHQNIWSEIKKKLDI
ncbi:thymidylate kinase [bacterium BMS3Abin05]|nr:thymidylate kinase [bacterium BMS3Abin05]GBE28429.1 thymidylate kinase [bacterium BMS3Bbin03]HDZ11930.1 dTMP kinase [Bacteroidota bacterium]